MSTSQCQLINVRSLKTKVLRAGCKRCGQTSLQRLPIDQRLSCGSGNSVGGVNSSTDSLLVESHLWQAEGQSDVIWSDAPDLNISIIPKQLRLQQFHCGCNGSKATKWQLRRSSSKNLIESWQMIRCKCIDSRRLPMSQISQLKRNKG